MNGGLKNLIKITESTVKNINDTITSVLIPKVLRANCLYVGTKKSYVKHLFSLVRKVTKPH